MRPAPRRLDVRGVPERADLTTLFQRLADTLVRLFTERVDLARVELREETERILSILSRLLLGAAAAAVGLVMLALAATDLLLPFVHSRAARLLLVGAPLLTAGALQLLRTARVLAGHAPRGGAPPAPEADPEILAQLDDELGPHA